MALKLQISSADVEQLRTNPLLEQYAVAAPQTKNLSSTYYDTPDFQIKRHNASLRLRQLEDTYVQTLQAAGVKNIGLHQQCEWEGPVGGPALDIPMLRNLVGRHTPLSGMLGTRLLDQRLHPIFDTRVTRTVWDLRLPGGAEIAFALDQGAIAHEGLQEPISEVALELKAGSPQKLLDFAGQLLDTVPLSIGSTSEVERGYALCTPSLDMPVALKTSRTQLSNSMTVVQGFRMIVTDCLAQIQENASRLIQEDTPEKMRQLHLGVRRLRAAMALFKDIAALPETLQPELDWLAVELRAVRDWDALSTSTLALVERVATDDIGLPALRQAVAGIAQEKHAQVIAALKSVRYTKLTLSLAGWLREPVLRDPAADGGRRRQQLSMRQFADTSLRQQQRRLLKRGEKLQNVDPQMWHGVRTAARRMGYANGFFQSLYPAKKVKRYGRSLSALQDGLKWFDDISVADGLLHQMENSQQDFSAGIGFARGYLRSEINQGERQGAKHWKQFTPWKAFR